MRRTRSTRDLFLQNPKTLKMVAGGVKLALALALAPFAVPLPLNDHGDRRVMLGPIVSVNGASILKGPTQQCLETKCPTTYGACKLIPPCKKDVIDCMYASMHAAASNPLLDLGKS